MGAKLKELTGSEVELAKSGGGAFEITVDGALRYSKRQTGRFPTAAEIEALAKS